MRTDRALEKLRATLAQRGITSTAAALGAMVFEPAVDFRSGKPCGCLAGPSLATAGVSTGLLATLSSIVSMKIITAAAVSALIFLESGPTWGSCSPSMCRPLPLETPRQAQNDCVVAPGQRVAQAEVDRLKSDVELLDTANARLTAQRATRPSAGAIPRTVTLGVSNRPPAAGDPEQSSPARRGPRPIHL